MFQRWNFHFQPHCRLFQDCQGAVINQSKNFLAAIDENLSLHDFRIIPYKVGKIFIFDVKVPDNFSMSDRKIRKEFQKKLIEIYPTFHSVINFDHEYC